MIIFVNSSIHGITFNVPSFTNRSIDNFILEVLRVFLNQYLFPLFIVGHGLLINLPLSHTMVNSM